MLYKGSKRIDRHDNKINPFDPRIEEGRWWKATYREGGKDMIKERWKDNRPQLTIRPRMMKETLSKLKMQSLEVQSRMKP